MLSTIYFLFALIFGASSTDYCARCFNHVACNNNGQIKNNCSKAYIIPMDNDIIHTFVYTHNKVRNKIAGGLQKGFSEASKMMAVGWNPELAYLAELNVKKCRFLHDECHSTDEFPSNGQNLYSSSTTKYKAVKKDLSKAVKSWYNEVKDANQDDINECCSGNKSEIIGHFTQVVRDEVLAIGCAALRFTSSAGWKKTLVACNYSSGNILGTPVYVSGNSTSQCLNGTDSSFEHLCNN